MAEDQKHLLLVDDEAPLREAIAERLADHGFVVEQAASGEQALDGSPSSPSTSSSPTCACPASTARRVIEAARRALPRHHRDRHHRLRHGEGRRGRHQAGRGRLHHQAVPVRRAAARPRTRRSSSGGCKSENAYLRSQLEERYRIDGIVGTQPRRCATCSSCSRPWRRPRARSSITGETGTGKELVARAIHHNSPRRAHRFVALNCSAIPETLLEAELFGHVRGAFTGAVGTRQGRLEQAHKGTLFLDEVGTMSPALQAKLLRVLQEREFERVGDSHTIKIDVRVIAATHSDLDADGRRGHVPRGSLLPAQRDSGAAAAAARAARRHSAARAALPRRSSAPNSAAPAMTMSQEPLRRLMAYSWPGNVRQLENAVERAVAFSQGRSQIEAADLPPEIATGVRRACAARRPFGCPRTASTSRSTSPASSATMIKRSLERTNGNKGAGGQTPQPEAHDADREVETAGTELTCLPAIPTGRSSSTACRPRFARRSATSCCRRSNESVRRTPAPS